MTIVLPNEIEGLAKLEENLEQLLATQSFTRELVAVSLPKFTIETDIKFKPILQNVSLKYNNLVPSIDLKLFFFSSWVSENYSTTKPT